MRLLLSTPVVQVAVSPDVSVIVGVAVKEKPVGAVQVVSPIIGELVQKSIAIDLIVLVVAAVHLTL